MRGRSAVLSVKSNSRHSAHQSQSTGSGKVVFSTLSDTARHLSENFDIILRRWSMAHLSSVHAA
eukprot:1391088-Amphidinium_carterae.1